MSLSDLPSIPETFTATIATRRFDLIASDVTQALVVEVGQPVQDVVTVTSSDWRCPVRLRIGETLRHVQACGIDAFQALSLALDLSMIEAAALAVERGGELRFLDQPFPGDWTSDRVPSSD